MGQNNTAWVFFIQTMQFGLYKFTFTLFLFWLQHLKWWLSGGLFWQKQNRQRQTHWKWAKPLQPSWLSLLIKKRASLIHQFRPTDERQLFIPLVNCKMLIIFNQTPSNLIYSTLLRSIVDLQRDASYIVHRLHEDHPEELQESNKRIQKGWWHWAS